MKNLTTRSILIDSNISSSDINLFFMLMDRSLEDNGVKCPKVQHSNFLRLCDNFPIWKRRKFSKIIDILRVYLQDSDEFEKLYDGNGGIICGGDDAFYDDFACWLIFRGELIFDNFLEYGSKYLISYITDLNIHEYCLTYENFRYDVSE